MADLMPAKGNVANLTITARIVHTVWGSFVTLALLDNGLEVTALHNQFFWDEPPAAPLDVWEPRP